MAVTKSEFFNESFKIIYGELLKIKEEPTDKTVEEATSAIHNILYYIFKKTEENECDINVPYINRKLP
jgi:hypothetical protein